MNVKYFDTVFDKYGRLLFRGVNEEVLRYLAKPVSDYDLRWVFIGKNKTVVTEHQYWNLNGEPT